MKSRTWWGGAVPVALTILAAAAQSCGSATLNKGNDGGAGGTHAGGATGSGGAGGRGTGGTVQGIGGQSGSGAGGTAGVATGIGGGGGHAGGTGVGGAVTSTGGTGGSAGAAGHAATGGAGGAAGTGTAGTGGTGGMGTGGAAGKGGTGGTATGGAAGGAAGKSGTGGIGTGGSSTGGTSPTGGTSGAAGGGSGGTVSPNLVFVSSRVDLKSNLGNLAAYDAVCNQLATSAGINNTTNNAFVALLGDSHTSALTRLGSARGFVRTDGAPVADDVTNLFVNNQMFNLITTNEHGVAQPFSAVLTGMLPSGASDPASNCNDWTTATSSASFVAGCSTCGPPVWFYWENGTCDFFTGSVYCFMNTQTAPLAIKAVTGKKIFLTNSPVAAGQDADAACTASKPSGTGTVKALRATTTAAASAVVNATAKYVRPDGILVAAGSDLIANKLSSGIWQQGNGLYTPNLGFWTGAPDLKTVGTTATTCANWTSTAAMDSAMWGTTAGDLALGWWQGGSTPCSGTYIFAACVEQ